MSSSDAKESAETPAQGSPGMAKWQGVVNAQDMKDLKPPSPQCHEKCEKLKTEALESLKVKILKFNMEKLGCKIPETGFFNCLPCYPNIGVAGGFVNDLNGKEVQPAVVLCEDNIERYGMPKDLVERTVVHELVHAYDHCRAKMDWRNCYHIACTEVRAATLSGDCEMKAEVNRGNFNVKGQGQKCIRRRAEISVAGHEHCSDIAKKVVEEVFESCHADRSPFIGKYYA